MSESISYVGMDVHKAFVQVALLQPGAEVPLEWRVPNTPSKVAAMVRKLRRLCDGPIALCYEAGPTGFELQRRLNREDRLNCCVIAPSLIPRKPGERVKTDRRDARKLAEYLKKGLLTEVQPPSVEDEARRELCRARAAAKDDEKRARQRLSKFLLRQGRQYTEGKQAWTGKYMRWLERQRFEPAWLQKAFDALLRALGQASDRLRELDQAVEAAAQDEAVREPVALLRCFKGIDTTTAMGLVTELYAFERFGSPKQLMAFVGMTPSEHSTGGDPNRFGITKAGNGRVRRLITEAAWNYSRSNKVGVKLWTRRKGQPGWAIDVADKALARLHRRYWALVLGGKHHNQAATAVGRELLGFIWVVLAKHQASQRTQEAHG